MTEDGPIEFVKPENPPDLSSLAKSLVMPGIGITFSDHPQETQIFLDPPVPIVRSSSDATGRILSLLSSTFARLSIIVRSCIVDARARQEEFRERNKLPKSAKIPYQPAPVSDVAKAVMRQCVSTIESLFGEAPAVYALEKFDHAIFTGDMRAFKIRLLFLKVRDSIKGSHMYRDFLEGLEDAISRSEKMAGCRPDPSPRRLSLREQERKERILRTEEEQRARQPELPLIWPDQTKASTLDDSDDENRTGPVTEDNESYQQVINNSCQQVVNDGPQEDENNIKGRGGAKIEIQNKNQNSNKYSKNGSEKISSNLTVKNKQTKGDFNPLTVKKNKPPDGPSLVRKAREYDTVEQILDDIDAGVINKYESAEEIMEDLEAGKITQIDALMFASALDRYLVPDESDENDDEYDREYEEGFDMTDEDEIDGDGEDGMPERDETDLGTPFSYNPRGFCGVGEDEW